MSILAAATALFVACAKSPEIEGPEKSGAVFSREGITPVTLTAGHETRTVLGEDNYILWNKGDAISLVKEGDNALQLLNPTEVQKMKEGEKKSIILVNPANNGCFLGFNGTERVRNSDGLVDLLGGKGLSPEDALSNLNFIAGLAENFRNNTDYIFTLERVPGGWLIYHRSSGFGLTEDVKTSWMGEITCSLGEELAPVDIQDGSSNGGAENVVTGREEQIWVRKTQGNYENYLLWSGGKGTKSLGWKQQSDAWTNWLFFEIPETDFVFTADSKGKSTTFTNDTGFSEGSSPWYAIYPESISPAVYGDELTFHLPHTQVFKPGTFSDGANVSVGALHGTSITFHSVCGVLKLSLKGKQSVQSISVKDKAGMPLWGDAVVPLSSIDSEDCVAYVRGGSDVITLDCGDGVAIVEDTATEFYFVVPVGAFANGFEVTIVTPSGTITKATSKANTIARADIKEMPVLSLGEVDVPVVNIENHVVRAYMAYGPYSSFGSSNSYLDASDVVDVANAANWSADVPEGFAISWGSRSAASVTVMENGKIWYTEDGVTNGNYTITNLTPGCTYAYLVHENGTLKAEGKFKTTGQVRMVSIPDAWNCRDLGGWTGLNGATIKYGKVFRTASLNGQYLEGDVATYENYEFRGQKEIDRLGIKAELDLRGDPYTGIAGQWGKEGTIHSASLLKTKLEGADFMRIMTDWGLIYPRMRSSMVQDVAWIISELKLGKPVAFHCRIGADRTGGVSYLIEGLLGVQAGDLARDYELTSFTSFDKNKRYASRPNQSFFREGLSFVREGGNLQERCYYYLNQYFSDVHINADDLDWFICEMLGLKPEEYKHPEKAMNYPNNSLESVYEANTGSASYDSPY